MVALGIPALRDAFFSDPLKSAARKTIGLVNGVRETALRNQQAYFLHISRRENRLWCEKDRKNTEGKGETAGNLRLPEGVRIREILTAGQDVSAQEEIAVWITRQGYMHTTSLRLEDTTGHALSLQFQPFVDSVQVTDPRAKGAQ